MTRNSLRSQRFMSEVTRSFIISIVTIFEKSQQEETVVDASLLLSRRTNFGCNT